MPEMKWHERMVSRMRERDWSVPRLAAEMGRPDDAALINKIYKYITGKVDNPRGSLLPEIAKALHMSETELRTGHKVVSPRPGADVGPDSPNAMVGGAVTGFVRIPIRGQGMGGREGALVFNTDQHLGDILAPPILHNIPHAYAVYVVGDSMLERFRDGEVVYVHPYMPVRKGDDCVVQIAGDEDGVLPTGWIKRFVSRNHEWLNVRQLNPVKTLRFPASRVISCHRIVMAGPV